MSGRGFIPTHVGNTRVAPPDPATRSVHPHTRGEHTFRSNLLPVRGGSSPHTWGTLVSSFSTVHRKRFIPTHVGNTRFKHSTITGDTVHPHTRGEHRPSRRQNSSSCGSSPHTWGTPHRRHPGLPGHRFIPTHVGNTVSNSPDAKVISVHPHTRGEHQGETVNRGVGVGSSPHTWGTRLSGLEGCRGRRFIPTHVGNT